MSRLGEGRRASACARSRCIVVLSVFGAAGGLLVAVADESGPSGMGVERPSLEQTGLVGLCGATCQEVGACNRADVPPPVCDPPGWGKTCADFISVEYNPGGVAIQMAHYYGLCTKYRGFSTRTVLCSRTHKWTEGGSVAWSLCNADGSACGDVLYPMYCQLCVEDTSNDWPLRSYVMNEDCFYDRWCCEPKQPPPM